MSHRIGFGRLPARLIAVSVAALAGAAGLSFTAPADAAFTTQKCAGADITGRGASFARDAHTVFNFNFKNNYCLGTPGAGTINVAYEALGSGAGRTAVKDRTLPPRFGMTDEPPSATDVAQMNAGTTGNPADDTNPNDNGQIHVIPAAVGAVAPLVNFPDACDVSLLPDAAETAPGNANLTRVRFTKAQFEGIWARDPGFTTWTEVFPELAADADCNVGIVRVVRFDESGTSFAFKDFLDTVDGSEGWLSTYGAGSNGTREWPGATFGPRTDCGTNGPGGGGSEDTDGLTSNCSNGNGALVSKLITTDGSVGYSDISTARNASPSLAVDPAGEDNDTYWTQIPNGSNQFAEPTADSNGYRTDGLKGSNCQATTFSGLPADTLGDWTAVSGVNSAAGYSICTLTYGLVFDDSADVWGNTPAEESKARTVKDYWDSNLSDSAQGQLFANDYAPLPSEILQIARQGMAQVDWNKGADPGPGPGPAPGPGPGPAPGPGPGPGTDEPDNKFSIPRTKVDSGDGSATMSVKLPGPGVLEVDATAKKPKKPKQDRVAAKVLKVDSLKLKANRAGTFELTIKPRGKAKKVLRKAGKLKTKVKLVFTPAGGAPSTETEKVTLRRK